MRRAQFASVSSLLGSLLITLGIFLVLYSHSTHAQDNIPEYEGIRECRSCHGSMARDFATSPHSQTLVDAEDEEAPLLADFSTGEDIRIVQFPDSAEARPFTANDIAFTLGTGRYVQRYLYKMNDEVYMVFPAEWNSVTNEWQAYEAGETWPSEAYNFNQNCAYCHVTGLNQETFEWEEAGVQCETCHGPGSEHVILMDDLEFILNEDDREDLHDSINIAVDPATCGQCHASGVSDTAHPYPGHYLPGEDLSESWTLVSEDSEAHWYAVGHAALPNMQYNEWLLSGHAASYESATNSESYELECLVCHSSGYRRALRILDTSNEDPEVLPIPEVEAERLPFGVTCSTCHNPHDDSDEAEDFNPREALYVQCTDCHQSGGDIAGLHHPVKEVYEGLPLIEEVEPVVGVHFSLEDGPICTTCHMPGVSVGDGRRNSHVLNPIAPAMAVDIEGIQDSCTGCHEMVEGQSMQDLIDAVQTNTQNRHTVALEAVTDDTPQWVSDSLLIVANDGSWGIHNIAYTDTLLNAAETELGLRESGTASLVLPQIPTPATTTATLEAETSNTAAPIIFGLTLRALILLGIALGIILIAGLAFFRGGRAS